MVASPFPHLPAVAPQSEGWSEAKDYRMVVISNFPSFQILVVNAGLTSNAYFAGPAEGYVGHGSFLHGCMTVVETRFPSVSKKRI